MPQIKKVIKKEVRSFKKEFSILNADYCILKNAAEKLGYTIVEFNRFCNNKQIKVIIDLLNLSDMVSKSKGFTYADSNYRLLFINDDLSESEKAIVIAHEIGHIYLGHLSYCSVIGRDVREEYEANEFSHYLLSQNKFSVFFTKHKKLIVGVFVALLLVTFALFLYNVHTTQQSYYGDYYVTATGSRYHEKDCIFVKSKSNVRRLSLKAFESGDYAPCGVCLPQND